MSFAPQISVLPEAQRSLWPALRQVSGRFVLYGGTALALRCGHRVSEDFDFFADAPIAGDELLATVPFLRGAVVRQQTLNTLTVTVQTSAPVKVSFFGLNLRRVNDPDWTDDGVARVASLLDIAGCKMAVLQNRSERKDYADVDELLKQGITVEQALGAAQAIYGGQFNPLISLKALVYFEDGDLASLPDLVKQNLRAASVIQEMQRYEPKPGGLVPAGLDR